MNSTQLLRHMVKRGKRSEILTIATKPEEKLYFLFVPGAIPAPNSQGHNSDSLKHNQHHHSCTANGLNSSAQFAMFVFASSF